jgi:hypothetical protein
MPDSSAFIVALAAMTATTAVMMSAMPGAAQAASTHRCDAVPEEGWSVVPERQVLGSVDGTPYHSGPAGNWYLDRVTTVLPFCHYFNAIGIYSLNSYSLAPVVTEERVAICRPAAQGSSVAIAPYAGPCPPK